MGKNVVEKALEKKRATPSKGSALLAVRFDAERREMYLELRRRGELRAVAARKVGVSPQQVARIRKLDPGFDDACIAAELESLEKAESKLWEAVEAGEPWAIQMVLKAGERDRWAPDKTVRVEVSGKVEVEAGERLARIRELELRLAERAELGLGGSGGGAELGPLAGGPGEEDAVLVPREEQW